MGVIETRATEGNNNNTEGITEGMKPITLTLFKIFSVGYYSALAQNYNQHK